MNKPTTVAAAIIMLLIVVVANITAADSVIRMIRSWFQLARGTKIEIGANSACGR